LSPTERAAYILREAFDYAYRDIANVLRLAETNARQVVTRARQHIASDRTTATSSTERKRLLEAFIAASQNGDVAGLERLFASDLVSASDGCRLVRSARSARSARRDRWTDPIDGSAAFRQRAAA
jgi:Sigma-70, region 4